MFLIVVCFFCFKMFFGIYIYKLYVQIKNIEFRLSIFTLNSCLFQAEKDRRLTNRP